MRLGISEILDRCSKMTSTTEKVLWLQHNDNPALRAILQYALDPRVVWLLPKGNPPYKPTDFLDQQNMLISNIRKINYFVENGLHPNMHQIKRETMFIEFLESLDPQDAKLLCAVKDKKIPYKGITVKLVNAAFPGLVSEEKKSK